MASHAEPAARPSDEASRASRQLDEKMDEEVLRQLIKRLLEQDPIVSSVLLTLFRSESISVLSGFSSELLSD